MDHLQRTEGVHIEGLSQERDIEVGQASASAIIDSGVVDQKVKTRPDTIDDGMDGVWIPHIHRMGEEVLMIDRGQASNVPAVGGMDGVAPVKRLLGQCESDASVRTGDECRAHTCASPCLAS